MTSNQRYGALNHRFDRRAELLRRFGFTYRIACEGVAVFCRKPFWREQSVPAALVMHADRQVWIDQLRLALRPPTSVDSALT